MVIGATMENIGVMVYHRIVPSVVVRNLVGTSTLILWKKLHPWITDIREELNNPGMFEWFEWLSIVLEEMNDDSQAPAYAAYKNWKPSRDRQAL